MKNAKFHSGLLRSDRIAATLGTSSVCCSGNFHFSDSLSVVAKKHVGGGYSEHHLASDSSVAAEVFRQ